jgi:hypothetical protein
MAAKIKRSVILTAKQCFFLKKEAAHLEITVSDLIRRIIDEWLEGPRYASTQSPISPMTNHSKSE